MKFLGTLVTAIATLLGAVIIGIFGKVIAGRFLTARDKQDKEAEWRNHAIELTKLDFERKIKARRDDDTSPMRPCILDFLANYRDLQELGEETPKDLYTKIIESRIKTPDSGKPVKEKEGR